MVSRSRSVLYSDPVTDYMTGYIDHHIAGAASYQTNYQVMFTIYRGYGTNTGSTVYIPPSEVRSDFNDLRFVDDIGRILPYWIESAGSTYINVWVMLYQIPTTGAIIRILYGGNTLPPASNGTTTFPTFFDHFDSTLDATKWTVTGGAVSVANSIATVYHASNTSTLYTVNAVGTNNIALRSRFKPTNGYYLGYRFDIDNSNYIGYSGENPHYFVTSAGANSKTQLTTLTYDYQIFETQLNLSTNAMFYIDGTLKATHTSNLPSGSFKLYAYTTAGKYVYLDWVVVRKFVSPEPTHGWWGIAEDL